MYNNILKIILLSINFFVITSSIYCKNDNSHDFTNTEPTIEKLKRFDVAIEEYEKFINLVSKNGEIGLLIDACIKKNQEKWDQFSKKVLDKTLNYEQRVAYLRTMVKHESTIENLKDRKKYISEIENDCVDFKSQIIAEKSFFMDMICINNISEANKSLADLNTYFDILVKQLDKIADIEMNVKQE